jgi:cell division protein FtsW (lipid II flippase)
MVATGTAPERLAPARTWRFAFPAYERGPKPRRRAEFWLLLLACGITTALYSLASLGQDGRQPLHLWGFLAAILGLSMAAHLVNRWLVPNATSVLLPIATLLNGIGFVEIARWSTVYPYGPEAGEQALWAAISAALYVGTLFFIRRSRDLDRYRYLLLLAAVFLLLAPVIPHIGVKVNGARLWVHVGSVQFQPVEIAKLLLVVFFASYFSTTKELLTIPSRRIGNHLFVDPRPLIPIAVTWLFALAILGFENDVGFAMLLFTLFLAMLWTSTGRVVYLVMGLVLFVVGALIAFHLFPQVHERISIWLDPWSAPSTSGYQLIQGWYSMAQGGILGTGVGLGSGLFQVPFLTSDMMTAAIGQELGMVGLAAVVCGFTLLVGTGLQIAQRSRTDFARLCAVGLTVVIGFQAFFIMAGVLRLLPFTGITLPFMAYGGSSLVANYVLIALLMRLSEEAESRPTAAEAPMAVATTRASSVVEEPRLAQDRRRDREAQRDRDPVGGPAVDDLVAPRSHEVELG